MPVVHAEFEQANARWEALGRLNCGMDCRIKSGNDERERTNERKIRRRNADRRKALLPCRRARPRLKREAHDCRRSTAALTPRSLSSQGTQPQAMLPGTRPVWMTGFPRPCLSQSSECTSRPGPSAEGLTPEAARERVASPARAPHSPARSGMPAGSRPRWARYEIVRNLISDMCQQCSDAKFRVQPALST
jgi:hypothetical protein